MMTAIEDRSSRCCVIGAGAAGLATVHALRSAGIGVDCFEQSNRVGGHWNTDYESLHLITSSAATGFPEFPMPDDWPMFPSRQHMVEYLNAYADRFALRASIMFETEVISVVPERSSGATGTAGWQVTTREASGHQVVGHYDGVFVANGHLWDQKVPDMAARFSGKQIHSGSYSNSGEIEGDTVLVVGCGNSGCDLAVDAAQAGLQSHIVMRRGHYFQPKTFFGKPRAELDFMQDFLPEEQDVITRLMMRLSVGTHDNYPGLPAPAHHTLAEGPPIVNELLLYWIRHGRITVQSGLKDLQGNLANFVNGTTLEVDTLLWATGFNVALPFLAPSILRWDSAVPLKLGASIFPQDIEKLYFIGLVAPRGPQPPVYSLQSALAARAAKLHQADPRGCVPITQELAAVQQPEACIDMLRHHWQASLETTDVIISRLEGEMASELK